jgi:hypothetical protein
MYFVSDLQKGIPKLKQQRARLAVGILFCALVTYQECLSAQSSDNWSFAVSGDSRNCGDIVMPGIAEGVRADGVSAARPVAQRTERHEREKHHGRKRA